LWIDSLLANRFAGFLNLLPYLRFVRPWRRRSAWPGFLFTFTRVTFPYSNETTSRDAHRVTRRCEGEGLSPGPCLIRFLVNFDPAQVRVCLPSSLMSVRFATLAANSFKGSQYKLWFIDRNTTEK
jgi:hypothetical protein